MRRLPKPSRRVIFVLVATIFVVAFVVVWNLVSGSVGPRGGTANGALAPVSVTRDPSLATERDEDHDGLLDWEEALRGTEASDPDTDRDGTQDGAEVATGRDPLTPAPNDEVETVRASSSAALDAELQALRRPGTLTDDFADRFAQAYISAGSSGSFDQAAQQKLVESLTGSLNVAQAGSGRYSAAGVPTDASVSISAFAEWFVSAHGEAFDAMGAMKGRADYPTLVGNAFMDLARELCSTPVPPTLAAAEAQVCNVNDQLGQGIASFAAADEDPLRAIMGIASMRAAEEQRTAAYLAVANQLRAGGYDFKNSRYPGFWGTMLE